MSNGKGDALRPLSIDLETYAKNYKNTFGDKDMDWIEDFLHKDGNHQCTCIYCSELFLGYKRRVVCRKCALLNTPDKKV